MSSKENTISAEDARKLSAVFRKTKPLCDQAPSETRDHLPKKPPSNIKTHPFSKKPLDFSSKASS